MSTAEQLADKIENRPDNAIIYGDQAAAELRRLAMIETAFNEWHTKTEWVQITAQPKELGKHRADVLRDRIEALEAENEVLGLLIAAMKEQTP